MTMCKIVSHTRCSAVKIFLGNFATLSSAEVRLSGVPLGKVSVGAKAERSIRRHLSFTAYHLLFRLHSLFSGFSPCEKPFRASAEERDFAMSALFYTRVLFILYRFLDIIF